MCGLIALLAARLERTRRQTNNDDNDDDDNRVSQSDLHAFNARTRNARAAVSSRGRCAVAASRPNRGYTISVPGRSKVHAAVARGPVARPRARSARPVYVVQNNFLFEFISLGAPLTLSEM